MNKPKGILLAFLLLFSNEYLAQNLVPNPYFNDFSQCPVSRGEIYFAIPWYSPNGKTTDFSHECATDGYSGIPANNWGIEFPAVGKGYAGLRTWLNPAVFNGVGNYREYLAVELLEPLEAGEDYWVSFKVSTGDSARYATDDIGLAFSDSVIPALDLLPYTPAIANIQGRIINHPNGWQLISGRYKASGDERHLVIGNFLDDTRTTLLPRGIEGGAESTYFYIDAVVVTPCKTRFPTNMIMVEDSSICPGDSLRLVATPTPQAVYRWEDMSSDTVFVVSEPGVYYLRTEVVGCSRIDSIEIVEAAIPEFDLGADTTLCPGEILRLDISDSLSQIVWSDQSTAPFLWAAAGATYKATLTLGKCSFSDSIRIASEAPYLQVPLLDTLICRGEDIRLYASVEDATYRWQDQSESSSFPAVYGGEYWVDIETNCYQAREYFSLRTIDCGCEQFIPNVFTPNGDGINEFFQPQFREGISDMQINIYDRWGQLMFQSTDPSTYWDGRFKGKQAPEGVYFWRIQYSCFDRVSFSRKRKEGHLSLLR